MAVLAYPGNLQTAQTGNADSTNTIQRLASSGEVNLRQMILRITSTIGATPTVTVNILGSFDGTNFFQVPYSPLAAAPGEWSVAAITITTAVTSLYSLMPGNGWRYLKLNMSANTNVTLTTDVF